MPQCSLMGMDTRVFLFQNSISHIINIQRTKFERKSIVTFIDYLNLLAEFLMGTPQFPASLLLYVRK